MIVLEGTRWMNNNSRQAKLIATTDREVADHEEVELLLEGYRSDLLELQLELGLVRGQIEDMREFINTHQVKNAALQLQPG